MEKWKKEGEKGEKKVGKDEKHITDFLSEEMAFNSWNILFAP